jgi:transcription antitermination factor NusG
MQHLTWYALKVHTRSEEIAATALRNRGYEVFAPIYHERRKYSDRMKLVEAAAFPGYIFCRFTEQTKVPVLSSPAVEYIVSTAGVPIAIPDFEIDAIRRALEAGAKPVEYLAVGQRVRIEYGSMVGVEGILTRTGGENRVTLSVDALHRSIAVTVDGDQVRPI